MRINKRVVAAVAAVVLAIVGIAALVVYANGAQKRAFAGRQPITVLQVKEKIPAGTASSKIDNMVKRASLPRAAVPSDVLKSLDQVRNKVTTATLVPGDVLTDARFSGSPNLGGTGVLEVPAGYQELTIELASTRVLGGALQPGDRVGVVASYDEDKLSNFVINKVLVLAAGGGAGDAPSGPGVIQIRLALKKEAVTKVVNAAEFGKVWLSRQNNGAEVGRKLIDPADVVK